MPDPRGTRLARVVFGLGEAAWSSVPERLRRRLEHRFFYAVFNVTRVTNDDYGWRPPERSPAGPDGAPDDPALR